MSNLELRDKVKKLEITTEKISALLVEVLYACYKSESSAIFKRYAHWKLLIDMALDYIRRMQKELIALDEETGAGQDSH